MMDTVLQTKNLVKEFVGGHGFLSRKSHRQVVRAVDGVSLRLQKQQTLAIVGESGCGKTTLGKLLLYLHRPDSGEVSYYLNGQHYPLERLSYPQLRRFRPLVQPIFQNPHSALNERLSVRSIIAEPLQLQKRPRSEIDQRVGQVVEQTGLRVEHLSRFPHSFSGGQKQRIGIARALVSGAQVLIADEAVSALDVSVQAQILNLLLDLKQSHQLSYIFISHDLGVVRYISDHICVMYLGQIVEQGPSEQLIRQPLHPYTESLLEAVPRLRVGAARQRRLIKGEVAPPSGKGCRFAPRCPYAQALCRTDDPSTFTAGDRSSRCHFAHELQLKGVSQCNA